MRRRFAGETHEFTKRGHTAAAGNACSRSVSEYGEERGNRAAEQKREQQKNGVENYQRAARSSVDTERGLPLRAPRGSASEEPLRDPPQVECHPE